MAIVADAAATPRGVGGREGVVGELLLTSVPSGMVVVVGRTRGHVEKMDGKDKHEGNVTE